jgi:hypothetical protein
MRVTEPMITAALAALRREMREGTPVHDYDGRVLRRIVRDVLREALGHA